MKRILTVILLVIFSFFGFVHEVKAATNEFKIRLMLDYPPGYDQGSGTIITKPQDFETELVENNGTYKGFANIYSLIPDEVKDFIASCEAAGYPFHGWGTQAIMNDKSVIVFDRYGDAVDPDGYAYYPPYFEDNGAAKVYEGGNQMTLYILLGGTGTEYERKHKQIRVVEWSGTGFGSDYGPSYYVRPGDSNDWSKPNSDLNNKVYFNKFPFIADSNGNLKDKSDGNVGDSQLFQPNVPYEEIRFYREFKKGSWNTLCVPFTIDSVAWPNIFDDVKILSDAEFSGKTAALSFSSITGDIKPGIPYLVKVKDSPSTTSTTDATAYVVDYVSGSNDSIIARMDFKNAKMGSYLKGAESITFSDTEGNSVSMVGCYEGMSPLTDSLQYINDNAFWVSGKEYAGVAVTGHIKGFRCYFEQVAATPSGSKALNKYDLSINFPGYEVNPAGTGGTADGIVNVATAREKHTGIYDLYGRRLNGIPGEGMYIVNGKKMVVH